MDPGLHIFSNQLSFHKGKKIVLKNIYTKKSKYMITHYNELKLKI